MAYTFPPEGIPQALAGLYMVLLAGAVAWLNLGSRLGRALGLFLLVRGATNLAAGLTPTSFYTDAIDPRHPLFLVTFMGDLAVPALAVYFGVAFRRRTTGRMAPRGLAWALVALTLLWESLFLLDPSLYREPGNVTGPLAFVSAIKYGIYVLVGGLLLQDAARSANDGQRRSLFLAGLAMALGGLFVGGHSAVRVWYVPAVAANPELATAGRAVQALALLALLPALPSLWRQARGASQDMRREAAAVLAALSAAALTGVGAGMLTRATPGLGSELLRTLDGLWTLTFPLLLSFAVFKHGLFEGDERARIAVRGSTIAGVGVAIFLIVTQLAEGFAQNVIGRQGWVVGAISAGLLLILIQPVQRLAERIATPRSARKVDAGDITGAERAEVYRAQAKAAWADGSLTSQERRLLDGLRRRLEISADDASRIESEVAAR